MADAVPASPKAPSARAELWSGVRDLLPLQVGVLPFGLVYGVLARASGIPLPAAMAMSSLVFAGSAQFVLAQLAGAGAPALVMVATVALVNLRHALYSASVAPHLGHLPARWKVALSYLLTDEAYAASIGRLLGNGEAPNKHWHLLGSGLFLWLGWQLSTAAGLLLGAAVPRSLPLDFALPLTFIAIVVPMIRSRAAVATALVAAAAALAFHGLPHKLGLVVAAATGMAAGVLATSLLGRRRRA
jgi:4-azaleucine resistance transporter AzlC